MGGPDRGVRQESDRRLRHRQMAEENKTQIIEDYKLHEGDTGSPEVQVALLTARIQHLTGHLQNHRKDHASRRGLLKLVGRRSALLKYLTGKDHSRYQGLIGKLGLRR